MENSRATFEAFDGVDVELPDGRTVLCRVLTIREAVRFLRLLAKSGEGDADAQLRFLEEFPAAIGLGEERLTPFEIFELAQPFFWASRRRSPTTPAGTQGAAETPATASTTTDARNSKSGST